MSAVRGRDPETALAAGANAVLLHQPLYPLLAHAKALSPQLSPDPRPAVGSAIRRIHGADMHQQSLIPQMATRTHTPPANPVFMVPGHAHPQNSALHTDRPPPPVTLNKGVLHFWPFAKYAVAFPRMSRSILTRDNSARKRLISICSTLTALLLAGPFRRPSRFALTQLYKVCSTTPRLRAAAAMLWPDSTIRTASCLNSSVYCARVAFVISVSLALLNHSARDTFCAGKVTLLFAPLPLAAAFLIYPTPLNLHKCFPTGGFLQTAVSDAPRRTFPSPPAHLLRGPSDTALAFLDNSRAVNRL